MNAKAIVTGICLSILVIMGVCGLYISHTEKTYGADAVVTHIEGSTISVVDEVGEGWQFYGEGYHTGQTVRLIMSNNHTPDRLDDIILRAVTL